MTGAAYRTDWLTPRPLFDRLDRIFHFTMDAAASGANALCPRYCTVDTDGLTSTWAGERVFCNPPYGRGLDRWVRKAAHEARRWFCTGHETVSVLLLPANTDTEWARLVFDDADAIAFTRGRVRFTDPTGLHRAYPVVGSMLAVWGLWPDPEPGRHVPIFSLDANPDGRGWEAFASTMATMLPAPAGSASPGVAP